jgi:hypothetical protein
MHRVFASRVFAGVRLVVFLASALSEPVSARLDDHKGFDQVVLRISVQDPFEFLVDRVLGRRQDAKINDSHAQDLDENKSAEVSVSCNKYAALPMGCREQFGVVGPRESDLTDPNNVMSQASQEGGSCRVNVLVE